MGFVDRPEQTTVVGTLSVKGSLGGIRDTVNVTGSASIVGGSLGGIRDTVNVTGSASIVGGSLGGIRGGIHGTFSPRGTTVTQTRERFSAFTAQWTGRHVGAGSTYVGSWYDVTQHSRKTLQARSSMGGSLHMMAGLVGSGVNGLTGTLASQRLGPGSYVMLSTSSAMSYVRPIVVTGSVDPGKGTLDAGIGRYV